MELFIRAEDDERVWLDRTHRAVLMAEVARGSVGWIELVEGPVSLVRLVGEGGDERMDGGGVVDVA